MVMKVSDIMKRHDFKKKFGQNFLTDKNLLNKIVNEAGVKNKDVIEIGPGMGALTKALLKQVNSLHAFEVDTELKPYLDSIKDEYNNFDYDFKDILNVDLKKDKEYHVVSNIPYNLTSPIIFKILENKQIKSATLMVQKEVALRITANPNSKDYNALTVIVNYYMDVKYIMEVKRHMFRPVPNVDSAVFKMDRKTPVLNDDEEAIFLEIVKAAFHQKRKTLANNLSFSFNVKKALINDFLTNLEIDLNARAEALSLINFINITKKWPF